jgi:hypothetical protein
MTLHRLDTQVEVFRVDYKSLFCSTKMQLDEFRTLSAKPIAVNTWRRSLGSRC